MKQTTIIFSLFFISVFLICTESRLNAQSTETGTVHMLVQQQIEEAKKKNNLPAPIIEETKPVKAVIKKVSENNDASFGIYGDYLLKTVIMLIASVAVFTWLKIRRSKRYLLDKNNRFKRNIKLMREEKFLKEIDPRLKEIRTRLTLTSVVLNEDKKVTAAARKSQIGKEEILLASRIRNREIQYNGQRSFA